MSDAQSPTLETGPLNTDQLADALFSAPAPEQPTEEAEAGAPQEVEEVDETAVDESPTEGDEESPESEDDDGDPDGDEEQEVYVITVDGKKVEATLQELIDGYSRTGDYRNKTRAVAEDRKALEAEREAFAAEQAEATRKMESEGKELRDKYLAVLGNNIIDPTDSAHWDKLKAEDPFAYNEQWADNERKIAAWRAEKAQADAAQAKQEEAVRAESSAIAVKAFPEWSEKGAFMSGQDARIKVAESLGFTANDVHSVSDFRFHAMLEGYARFLAAGQEATAKKAKVVKKVRKAPVRSEPATSAKAKDGEESRVAKLRKSGSLDDFVEAIFEG